MNQSNLPIEIRPRHRRTISALLEDYIAEVKNERFTLAEFLSALGPRAHGVTIIIFALPNLILGGIPGVSTVLGFPIFLLAMQMMLGFNRPWVPKFLGRIEFKRSSFQTVVGKAAPYLNKVERLFRPRWMLLTGRYAKHFLGALCIIVTLVLMLPVLFGNFMPALGLTLIGIGLIERDGFCIIGGLLAGIASMVYATLFYGSIMKALLYFMP